MGTRQSIAVQPLSPTSSRVQFVFDYLREIRSLGFLRVFVVFDFQAVYILEVNAWPGRTHDCFHFL